MKSSPGLQTKSPPGIAGFDEITGGGLPAGRATLLAGGAGSGKTTLSVQLLMHGTQICKLKPEGLDAEQAVRKVRATSMQTKLISKQVERVLLIRRTQSRQHELTGSRIGVREPRGADAVNVWER